jgi:type IV secretory pathway VirB9-like protein
MEVCRAKQWTIKNRQGHKVILRDVFAKIATWIDKFKQVGDVAIQYDPGHAALPWAAIRFVLQVVRY